MDRPNRINYVIGDATRPIGEGPKIIAHICNDVGAWGKGFVLAISKRWKLPGRRFHELHAYQLASSLGSIQKIQVEDHTWVVNMIAQRSIRTDTNPSPIRLDALRRCLEKLAEYCVPVHMPRIGTGLAGGKWEEIEPIINETLIANGIPVTVYDLEPFNG